MNFQGIITKISASPARVGQAFQTLNISTTNLIRQSTWSVLTEISLIVLWSIWVGRALLNFSTYELPTGGEFSSLIQSHFVWANLARCGYCFIWNGFVNGGAPAFSELSGAVLHPLVWIPALIWGVINGSKVTIVGGLALGGFAQWLLARNLGLGRWARLWSAFLVVAGGHMTGKMENGMLATIIGQGSAALLLATGVDLLFNRRRKALVWFALSLALTILSGSGYTQIGTALAIMPALALLCLKKAATDQPAEARPAWRDLLIGSGLALLFSSTLLFPLAHLYSQMRKDANPAFSNFPPLEYIALNLVIRDPEYYRATILGKDPYTYTHILYIGWVPVLLAFFALRYTPARLTRILWSFLTGILLVFLITSLDLVKALSTQFPALAEWRHLTLASGLAVPFIVGLASISLDRLMQHGVTPQFTLESADQNFFSATIGQLILIPLALMSLVPVYNLSQEYLSTHDVSQLAPELDHLQTRSAQWVRPPIGHYDWVSQALDRGLKIGDTWRPWFWKGHEKPLSYSTVTFRPDYDGTGAPVAETKDFLYFVNPVAEYAVFQALSGGASTACQATSQGGSIDVTCPNLPAGTLTINEYTWSGWRAWIDGRPAALIPSQYLQVYAQAGTHRYQFRYLPWDVPLGLLLTVIGIVLSIRFLFREGKEATPKAE